jgi:hypothetical protein
VTISSTGLAVAAEKLRHSPCSSSRSRPNSATAAWLTNCTSAGLVDHQDGVGRGVEQALQAPVLHARTVAFHLVQHTAAEQPAVGLALGEHFFGAGGQGVAAAPGLP